MANYNKQVEKWMSKASFDKLDLSTIPEGTEINIVGDIVESDLSLELRNKINQGPKLHLYALKIYDPQTDTNVYYAVHIYSNKDGLTAETIANEIIVDDSFGVKAEKQYPCFAMYVPSTGGTDYLVGYCGIYSLAVSDKSLVCSYGVFGYKYSGENNVFTNNVIIYRENQMVTVEQLF